MRLLAAAPLLLLSALFAAPAQAQSVLVSNAGQQDSDTPSIEQAAQSFTTGSNTSGYNLTTIVLNCSCQGYTSGTVTLHSGSRTGNKVADFTASVAMDDLVLTPTQTVTLSANTTYVIVTGDNFDAGTTWFITNSDSEDDGAAAGWSIANDSEFYQSGTTSWVTSSSAYQLTVNGHALGITPSGLRLDAPSGTAGFLRVRWEAEPMSSTAYHIRARPTVDTDTAEYRGKYFTGNRLVRVDAAARDYTFYGLVPGITYRSQVCRVTAIHTLVHEGKTHSVPGYDTLGECSPWQNIRLPAASDAGRNDVKVSLEFPDGSARTTLTPDTHGTLNYRVRLSGINDLSQYRSPRWGAGSWALFLKPNESRKTVRFGLGYGQVPEYFGHVARGANLSHLTWDRPTSGYIDQSFTLTSTQRGRGPLIVELFDHRTNDRHTDLGSQRKLCVDFEDAMGDVAAPCPGGSQQAADPPTVDGTPALSGAGDDGSWSEGEKVGVTVTFSEAVEVDTTGGTPTIGVVLGGPGGAARSATYESGSGTTELVFGYTLVVGDGTHEHMAVTPNSLAAGGGTIRGAESEVDADLAHVGAAAAGNLSRSAGPTASFREVPVSHDGATAFKLELRFSGVPSGLNAKRDAASVLEVTGGSVTEARQTEAGANPVWEVTVTPAGAGGVTVRVPVRACSETHAVCIGGQPLGEAAETAVPGPPLTARFTQAPAAHDGSSAFVLNFAFSHAPTSYSWSTVRDRLFEVTGGRVEKASRLVKGSNLGWAIRVAPDGGGAVTLNARATTDCAAEYAACDASGRMFDGELETTVAGPDTPEADTTSEASALPTVSIAAPVTTPVTEGTALAFTLTRTGATDAGLTVNVSVSESGAVLGNAPPATATFAANSATATLSVPTVDDGTVEDASTVTAAVEAGTGYTVDADAGSASGTVESEDVGPITARFTQAPAEHNGSDAFEMRFAFSHAPTGYNWTTVRDRLFEVTGGRIEKAGRLVRGSNLGWKFRVRPDGLGPVTLDARATTDCAAQYAACDAAGRMFDGELRTTVLGPPTLSVADAEVEEADGATLDFVVTLSRVVPETVTVAYATSDGTATAGEDYTGTSGTLRFATGDTEKTVSVPILNDALNEGRETFTLTLTNASGARIDDGEATGTIENADPLQTMWLSRFGRTVADHVAGAVSDRLANPMTGAQVTVGGQNLDLARMEDGAWLDRTMVSMARILGVPDRSGPGDEGWPDTSSVLHESPAFGSAPVRSITGREILLGSSFHLAGEGGDGGTGLAAWGRVTTGSFDGEAPGDAGTMRIDGEVTTGILGTDAEWGRVLAGVALSVSEGEGTFDQPGVDSGEIESTMTTGSPYARVDLNDRVSAWGMAGLGTGDMTIVQNANTATNQPERITRTDLSLRMAAVGGRGMLMQAGESGGMDLALRADAFLVQTESDAVSGEGDTKANASRVRLILEGSRAFQTGNGLLTPGLELGLRHDGGDAETGTGVELGGRISYANPETGLSLEANVRALVAHEDSGYEEWGASGALRLAPGERGRGLSFRLAPTYGAPGSSVEQLRSARDAGGLASGGSEFDPESRLEGEIGYGLPAFGDRFTGTPNIGFGLADGGSREYRLGWRLARAGGSSSGSSGSFALSLDATRSEPANANGAGSAPEHAIVLRARMRW